MPSRSATETCHFEDVLHYQARLRGEVIVLKKSIRLLGLDSDPCAPHLTLHTGTRLWFTNILSSTWSLGSKPAQIRPFVQQRGSFTNSFWQKEGGSLRGLGRSEGCSTVATSLSLAHRLGFECRPANFQVPRFFAFPLRYRKVRHPSQLLAVRCELTVAPKRSEKKGSVGCDEELARAEAFCSESHG